MPRSGKGHVDKVLEKVRKLRAQIAKTHGKKIKLPRDVIEVKALPPQEVHKKLHEVIKEFTEKVLNGEEPFFLIPDRSSDNVIYDPATDMVFLRRRFRKRSFLSAKSVREATITARILSIVHELLEADIHATKREVFYNDVVLFQTQRESDEALEDVAAMLGVERNSLHVVAAAKGAVIGRLRFKERVGNDVHEIDCTKLGTGGWAISPLVDRIFDIESDAEFILVVEKDAAFLRLAEDRFYEKYPCIIVTGKGQPDIGTRMFLKLLVRELKLPVFALVDSDPFGVHIMLVYAVGSKRMSYETPFITIPDIKWLGVRPSDLDRYGIPKTVRIPMTKKDIERGKQLLQEEFIQRRPKYKEEIEEMLRKKEKAEIQALASKGFRYLTEKYLPEKLETGDWI
ncbi:MAG: hypothetical protein ACTSX9_00920 [Candidatus Njordarchaeales archaeon]